MLRMRLHPAYLLGLIVVLAACGDPSEEVGETDDGRLVFGQAEERGTVERGVAPGERVLVLDGFHGDIYLDASHTRFASLDFERIARGENSEAARELLGQVTILEEGTDTEYIYRIQSPDEERSAVDISGSVPEQASLRINWSSGAISVSGPDGPLHITNGSGSVEVAGVAANAEIRVANGSIVFGAERLPDDAEVILETSNGDVTVSLPFETSAQVAAETSAGSIRTTGLEFQDRKLESQGAGSAFEGRLGRGNGSIRVRTENGTIHLIRGRMEVLMPDDTLAVPFDTSASALSDSLAADTTAADTAPFD